MIFHFPPWHHLLLLMLLFTTSLILASPVEESEIQDELPSTTPIPSLLSSGDLQADQHYHPASSAAWNFSHWWQERNNEDENSQLYAETPVELVFDEPNSKPNSNSNHLHHLHQEEVHQYINTGAAADHNFDHHFGQVQYKPASNPHHHDHLYPHANPSVLVTSNPLEVDRLSLSAGFSPVTSVEILNATIRQYFALSRHWSDDRDYMRDLRESLKEKFLSYGLKTAFHVFKTEENHSKMPLYPGAKRRQTATNIIAILPGKHRGTPADEIFLVGAHYDTVKKSSGVDDNGSGSAAVLEIARLLTKHKCYFNRTIIFTLFDLEEEYLKGSKYFVQQYLIPTEIRKNKAKFNGAYIMDMLLAYNTSDGSQSLRDFWPTLPAFVEEVKETGARGNFLSAWARRNIDQNLFFFLQKNWRNRRQFPLKLMDPPLPTYSHEVARSWSKYSKYGTFARSDHASFWYPIEKDTTFHSLLLSDLGPWRRDMTFHYHRPGDDLRWLRRENLAFMKNTVDSLVATLLDIGQGFCLARK